jgi:endo-1,4-beta-xylanase
MQPEPTTRVPRRWRPAWLGTCAVLATAQVLQAGLIRLELSASDPVVGADERFMREVVEPNIRRHRQSEAVVAVVDAENHPMIGARFTLRQTRQAFAFGCSLDHFVEPPAPSPEFKAPLVSPQQLERFKEVFNSSVIAYSAQWSVMEPQEGHPQFEDLDRYVAWCATNGIGLQFHFLSGCLPEWMKSKSANESQAAFLAHAQAMVARYGDRIRDWQVVDERYLLEQSPEVIRWFRTARPDLRLGIADCARFSTGAETNGLRGLKDVSWLREQGAPVDFFGFHGHRPFGLWADPQTIYRSLDAFARENVRVFVTECGVPDRGPIVGSVRTGEWTPELQADYYRLFFRICFSHPAVDGVNLWGLGPRTWVRHAGLLDASFEPLPAFHALKRLIREEWMTRLGGALPQNGRTTFRGFHGAYELAVTPRDGTETRVFTFELTPAVTNVLRFAWQDGSVVPRRE